MFQLPAAGGSTMRRGSVVASGSRLGRRPLQDRLPGRPHFVGPADDRGVRRLVQQLGRLLASMRNSASAKASSVSLLSVSVGSIIIASGHREREIDRRRMEAVVEQPLGEVHRERFRPFSCFSARGGRHELVHAAVAVRHRQDVLDAAEQVVGVEHGVLRTPAQPVRPDACGGSSRPAPARRRCRRNCGRGRSTCGRSVIEPVAIRRRA